MSKKQDDAAKIAGMASILKNANLEKELPPPAPPQTAPDAAPPSPVPRSKSGQVGKYRDPNYHQYGIYLRKDTHKRVKRALEDMEAGKDLSELLQELLEQWLAAQK